MRRIGLEEKRLDSRVESSFYPGIYKPTVAIAASEGRPGTASSHPQEVVATITTDSEGNNILDESDLYLPCHYFNYIGGTSTGGSAFHPTYTKLADMLDLGSSVS
jgi:hypothetical protein